MTAASEPVFNVPKVVTAILAVLVLVHGVRALGLSPEADTELLRLFAFIPARYDPTPLEGAYPGGIAADIWTFVTYALIHGDLTHLGFNAIWFLAFGSPVARRFGLRRFVAFFAATAAAGAAAHLATHAGEPFPMVGASAAISGCMAASMRFVFQRGGVLGLVGRSDDLAYRVPAATLAAALRDRRIVTFLAAWFGLNLLFGATSWTVAGGEQPIAWEAHIGGFLAGLVGFAIFDPVVPAAGARDDRQGPDAG